MVEDFLIEKVADLIHAAKMIVVFTGAGISTESGIPDFRSPGGIWDRYNPEDFTYQKFLSGKEARKLAWQMFVEFALMADAQPNPAHYAIAELEKLGKLDCVITQNVDRLHQKAGNSEDKVTELHGNIEWAKCLECGRRYPMKELIHEVKEGISIPECKECRGILKPESVFFGEPMPVRETAEAQRRSQNCDLCVVMGSSLVVYPAASVPRYALQSGAKLVIVNREPTDLDQAADVCIHGRVGEVMPRVMERVREKLGKV
jgi:NAD-dependent deacetylase